MTRLQLVSTVLALLLASCGGEEGGKAPVLHPPGAYDISTTTDLGDAVRVLAVKEGDDAPASGSEVEVVGRIRQMADGVLTIVDDELVQYCGAGEFDCGCKTPWDYCCMAPKRLKRASLTVELRDRCGCEIPEDAMELRLLDLVAFKGKLSQDPDGTFVLTTSGEWFRRERPDLPDGLDWPE